MPPRTKSQRQKVKDQATQLEAVSAADGVPKRGARKGMIPKPPTVFTDIPAVTKVLDDATGHYRYEVDHDALWALASTHASYEQLATVFKVPEHVLQTEGYRAIIEDARANALIGLRASQFKSAVEDRNPTMQIWLGKQLLGQKDLVQNQQLGADGRPIDGFKGPTFIAFMPPNGRDLSKTRQITATATIDGQPIPDSASQDPAA